LSPVDEYINVCDIGPIFIVKTEGGYGFASGLSQLRQRLKLGAVVSIYWALSPKAATRVAHSARRAGLQAEKSLAEAVLQAAAAENFVQLTPNLIVVSRATIAAKRLRDMIDTLDKSGALGDFKRIYRLRRMAATARGDGFMSFNCAMKRLRRTLIGMLAAKRPINEMQPIFDEVLMVR
jgi:hypothetical protein